MTRDTRAPTRILAPRWRSGDLDEAVAVFRKALALEPDSLAAHFNLGMALRDNGDLSGALCITCVASSRPIPRMPPFTTSSDRRSARTTTSAERSPRSNGRWTSTLSGARPTMRSASR